VSSVQEYKYNGAGRTVPLSSDTELLNYPHCFAHRVIKDVVVIIIIIIIIITISFMQGIYTHIPETNNVPKEYNIAAILSLLFMMPISLVPMITL
jgi:hypothetical protein